MHGCSQKSSFFLLHVTVCHFLLHGSCGRFSFPSCRHWDFCFSHCNRRTHSEALSFFSRSEGSGNLSFWWIWSTSESYKHRLYYASIPFMMSHLIMNMCSAPRQVFEDTRWVSWCFYVQYWLLEDLPPVSWAWLACPSFCMICCHNHVIMSTYIIDHI